MQCQRPSTMRSAFLQSALIGSFIRGPLLLSRTCAHYSSSSQFNPARLIEPPTMAATETLSTGASPVPNVEDAPPVTALPVPPPPPSLSLLGDSMQFKKVSGLRAFARAARMFLQIRGRVANGSVLTGRIGGALPEELVFRGLLSLGQPRPLSLETATRSLRLAAHDPRIKHAFFRIETLDCGWARVMELRRHLQYFSQAGKGITVFMEAGGPKEFFLAMGFECFVPPEAQFRLRGFDASGSFVRGVLEKIGAEPHVERIGKYKSAGDQLARRDMSEAQREVLESVVGEISTAWVQSVSEACGKTAEEVREVLDRAPQSMQEYVDAGFLSGIMYESDVEDMLKLRFLKHYDTDKDEEVLKRKLKTVDVQAYTRRNTEKTVGMAGKKRIALIRASGAITSGKNGSNPFIGSTLGSDTLVEIIRKVRDDKRYVACILRCDSPGGSGLASDVMWRELRKLAKKKPLVASMGDVAASGGYYISMACDIVAEKLTITGSIGVVSAKITLQDLYRKIGYRKETISIGKYAELLADERPFTPDEAQYFRTGAELAYKSFVTKAAMCRGKSYEDMQAVAQGRAWTGRQAKEVGLVDHLGGLSRAVQLVKEKCGLKEEEFVRLETVRAPMTFAQRLGLSSVSMEEGIAALDANAPLALADLPEGLGVQNPLSRLTAAAALPKLLTLIDGAACAGSSAAQAIMEALRKAL